MRKMSQDAFTESLGASQLDASMLDCFLRPLLSQMQVLKGRVPNKGFKSFAPQEEAVGFEFPSDYGSWFLGLGLC